MAEPGSLYERLLDAATHHQAGRFAEAEALYREVLEIHPGNRDANHNLGVLAMQRGLGAAVALPYFRVAWEADPSHAQHGLSYLRALVLAGELEAARRLHAEGRARGIAWPAVETLRPAPRSTAGGVADPGTLRERGLAAWREGRRDEAVQLLREAMRVQPRDARGAYLLGECLRQLGLLGDAEGALRQAIAVDAALAPAHQALAAVASAQRRFDAAVQSLQAALRLEPALARAHTQLGAALAATGRLAEAADAYRRALALDPGDREAHSGLGALLLREERLAEAEAHCRAALARDPQNAEAHVALASLLVTLGRPLEAQASYRAALALRPDELRTRSALLFALNYEAREEPGALLEEARAFGRIATAKASAFDRWACDPAPERLRVGLVSGDLGLHPVGYFLEGILACDFERTEWIAYPTVPETDELSARLQRRMSGWRCLAGLPDREAAKVIRDDGIHVLFDLAGHAPNNRLPLFSWRPAPVQATWLGYFATTGVAEIDYLLADATGVPPGQAWRFTETVMYLPDTRLCFSAPSQAPPVAPLPALGRGRLTFGSFQPAQKITDETLAAWSGVLERCPGAHLRLQNKAALDPVLREALLARLAAHGIDAARVELHRPTPRADYLAAHAEVDLILDTFPYPGGTTTCESLWMGVPTLTLCGGSMIERQGASLLAAAGLGDWIAASREDYVERTVARAADLAALAALRASLRERVRAAPLFDAGRFARHLQEAIAVMWRERGAPRVGIG